MSSYTMQLRTIIEQATQDNPSLTTRERIEEGRKKLFDFDYEIFDETYRKVFETKFIRKFYMREIGFETEGLFKFQLETWLMINMPYFNKLWESELLTFDPLKNQDVTVSTKKTTDSDSTSQANGNQSTNASRTDDGFSRHLESDTPDKRLAITTKDGSGVIEYASKIDENKSTATNTATGTTQDTQNVTASVDSTEDYLETRLGKTGDKTYSKMLEEYRNSLIRIENQIFNEMQELFMLVY